MLSQHDLCTAHAVHSLLLSTDQIMVLFQAKPSMTKSSVVDNETGKSIDSTVRTSTGTFFARGQNPVLAAVEKRIAQVGASQTFTHTSTPAWGSLVLQLMHSSCQHAKCMINQTPACQYLLHCSI